MIHCRGVEWDRQRTMIETLDVKIGNGNNGNQYILFKLMLLFFYHTCHFLVTKLIFSFLNIQDVYLTVAYYVYGEPLYNELKTYLKGRGMRLSMMIFILLMVHT